LLIGIYFVKITQKRRQSIGLLSFLERCVPCAERDVHYARDVGFAALDTAADRCSRSNKWSVAAPRPDFGTRLHFLRD